MERLGKGNSPFIHRGNFTSGIPELNTAPNSELWVVFNLNKEFSELSRAVHTHSEWQHFPQNLPENAGLNPKSTVLDDGQPIITEREVFR